MPFIFTRPRQVAQLTTRDNVTFDVQPGSYWTFGDSDTWISWTVATTGERLAAPSHHVKSIAYDGDSGSAHEDLGFG